jgi:hypothetical protein
MAHRRQIPLPRQWPQHVKSGVLHARLEQAETEIALLREELYIKDGRCSESTISAIECVQRLGGMLRFYRRGAA